MTARDLLTRVRSSTTKVNSPKNRARYDLLTIYYGMTRGCKCDHGLKSEVTLKVHFKQTVAMAIMKVYFRWPMCDHGLSFTVLLRYFVK